MDLLQKLLALFILKTLLVYVYSHHYTAKVLAKGCIFYVYIVYASTTQCFNDNGYESYTYITFLQFTE